MPGYDLNRRKNIHLGTAQLEFISALGEASQISPDLDAFLRIVFSDQSIMNAGAQQTHTRLEGVVKKKHNFRSRFFGGKKTEVLEFKQVFEGGQPSRTSSNADRIYNLYNATRANNPRISRNSVPAVIEAIAEGIRQNPYIDLKKGFLQSSRVNFEQFADLVKQSGTDYASRLPHGYFYEFYYFPVNRHVKANYRVYLNLKAEKISDFTSLFKEYFACAGMDNVSGFKFSGPASMSSRSDSVVIYVKDKPTALGLANYLKRCGGWISDCYNEGTPKLTQEIAEGISIGAEPNQHVNTGFGRTGLQRDPERPGGLFLMEKKQKSFGSLRAQAIAAAVVNFNENKKALGNDFNTFKRFVSVAFRTFGVDPESPADNLQ